MLFHDDQPWTQVYDGNDLARSIFDRHYSRTHYRDGRNPKLFVGPGEKLVLLHKNNNALFVWRKFISDNGQTGVNCAVFRNESIDKSSFLLKKAMDIALKRWPGERLYTYVDAKRIRSVNPGYCFKICGWKTSGITKINKLVILEYEPPSSK